MEQNEFEQWQNIWQGQKASSTADTIIKKLNKIEHKSRNERRIILVLFPITLIVLTLLIPLFESLLYIMSISFTAIAMLMILFLTYKNKINKTSHEDLDNTQFLQEQIKHLHAKMKLTSFYMWIYFVLILLGINIAYLEALKTVSFWLRIVIHFSVSFSLLVFMYFSIQKRLKKYKKELLPLIEQMDRIKSLN